VRTEKKRAGAIAPARRFRIYLVGPFQVATGKPWVL
jgi:hypothetical protein